MAANPRVPDPPNTEQSLEEHPMERVTLNIDGMTCGHCVRSVDGALKELAGVTVEQVKIGQATVSFDPAAVTSARIAQAIESEGYGVTAIK